MPAPGECGEDDAAEEFSNKTGTGRLLLYIVRKDAPVIPLPLPPARGSQPPSADLDARTDDELMRLAAAGVVEAFSALVRRHQRAVCGLCAKMLGSRDAGDDVAQEVFVEIWRACGRYQGQGQFHGFLFASARNRCLKALRARPSTVGGARGVGGVDGAAPAEPVRLEGPVDGQQIDALLAAERRQHLDRLVWRLPPKLRDAIWLRFVADLDYPEIAAIAKRPEETVRGRVFQGLKRLRALLEGAPERRRP